MRIKPVNLFDDKSLFLDGEAIRGRQGDTSFVDSFADPKIRISEPDVLAVGIARLKVEGIKKSSGLNIPRLKVGGKCLGIRTKKRCKPEYRLTA
jgi:hypothetical protein